MVDNDETTLLLARLLQELRTASAHQKLTATAVADLALGLNAAETGRRRDAQQLVGLILTVLPGAEKKPAKAKKGARGDESSDVFKLPGGNSLELTHTTQRRIVNIVLIVLAFVATHVAAYFALPHPERPPAGHQGADAVSGPSLRAPRLETPRLEAPRVP